MFIKKYRRQLSGALVGVLGLALVAIMGLALGNPLQVHLSESRSPANSPPKMPTAQLNPPQDSEAKHKEDYDFLEDRANQTLREHMDQSGKIRPDLWQKGIAEFKRLPVIAAVRRRAQGN